LSKQGVQAVFTDNHPARQGRDQDKIREYREIAEQIFCLHRVVNGDAAAQQVYYSDNQQWKNSPVRVYCVVVKVGPDDVCTNGKRYQAENRHSISCLLPLFQIHCRLKGEGGINYLCIVHRNVSRNAPLIQVDLTYTGSRG